MKILRDETRDRLRDMSISDEELLDAAGSSTKEEAIEAAIRPDNFFINPAGKKKLIESWRRLYPEARERVVREADEICAHRFDLLGSGPSDLGKNIDWHRDFKSGYRWKPGTYFRRIRWGHRPGVDIKVPWELSRFQHLPVLGKAYWSTGDEKYALEFADEVTGWIDSNRPGFGVNWACAMEAAIRLVNLTWAYAFFARSESLSTAYRWMFLKSILAHARHITANLEDSEPPNNHYTFDLAGLFFFGMVFKGLPESKRGLDFAMRNLVVQMERQVSSDGVAYEGSTAYHRLATELFLYPFLLAEKSGMRFPEEYKNRIEKMLEFIMFCTGLDGRVPSIGDADDGRLFINGPYSGWDRRDYRYLLSAGAVLFRRPDFKLAAGGFHEEAFWLLGPGGAREFEGIDASSEARCGSRAFSEGGVYVMRKGGCFAVIDALPSLPRGYRGHRHNSRLAIALSVGGGPALVDPGACTYTAEPEMRNTFRSTAYHNTIRIDGEEQNRFSRKSLFYLEDDAEVEVLRWESCDLHDLFEARHTGYVRLKEPVVHWRTVLFDKKNKAWLIRDFLEGAGEHLVEVFFHFRDREPSWISNEALRAGSPPEKDIIVMPLDRGGWEKELADGWFSPSYGVRLPSRRLVLSRKGTLPAVLDTLIISHDPGEEFDPEGARELARLLTARILRKAGRRDP